MKEGGREGQGRRRDEGRMEELGRRRRDGGMKEEEEEG